MQLNGFNRYILFFAVTFVAIFTFHQVTVFPVSHHTLIKALYISDLYGTHPEVKEIQDILFFTYHPMIVALFSFFIKIVGLSAEVVISLYGAFFSSLFSLMILILFGNVSEDFFKKSAVAIMLSSTVIYGLFIQLVTIEDNISYYALLVMIIFFYEKYIKANVKVSNSALFYFSLYFSFCVLNQMAALIFFFLFVFILFPFENLRGRVNLVSKLYVLTIALMYCFFLIFDYHFISHTYHFIISKIALFSQEQGGSSWLSSVSSFVVGMNELARFLLPAYEYLFYLRFSDFWIKVYIFISVLSMLFAFYKAKVSRFGGYICALAISFIVIYEPNFQRWDIVTICIIVYAVHNHRAWLIKKRLILFMVLLSCINVFNHEFLQTRFVPEGVKVSSLYSRFAEMYSDVDFSSGVHVLPQHMIYLSPEILLKASGNVENIYFQRKNNYIQNLISINKSSSQAIDVHEKSFVTYYHCDKSCFSNKNVVDLPGGKL